MVLLFTLSESAGRTQSSSSTSNRIMNLFYDAVQIYHGKMMTMLMMNLSLTDDCPDDPGMLTSNSVNRTLLG